MSRSLVVCQQCGEERELAAKGLCFKCYRAEARSALNLPQGFVDRHNPAIRKEHKKIIAGFAKVLTGLSDLGVNRTDVHTIRSILDPYLTPVTQFIEGRPAVNSEHESDTLVHSSLELTKE